jgi:hypothetical protein
MAVFLPLFARACASALLTALDRNKGNEGPRPADAAGTGFGRSVHHQYGKGHTFTVYFQRCFHLSFS